MAGMTKCVAFIAAFAVLAVAGGRASVARAAGPSVVGFASISGGGAAGPSVLGVDAFPRSGAPSTTVAGADTSGCLNRAVTSKFRENLASQTLLPLEQLPADAVSVPTWSGSFTTAGTTYPFTMVGTDPTAGSATTHVPVEIIPLSLDFAGSGCVLRDSGAAADLKASPLFAPTQLPTGVTQYLDDYERTNFWSTVSTASPGYHLLLDPSDIPAVTLHVPPSQGITVFDPLTDRTVGIVGGGWFLRQLEQLLGSLQISPTTLAAFVPYNTYATDQNPTDCLVSCAFYTGFHDAILSNKNPHAINTFVMASEVDYGVLLPPNFDLGTAVLSHEIVEWANDPFDHGARIAGQIAFLSNTAPAWSSPYFAGGSVCTSVLEVADPLEEGPILGAQPVGSPILYLLANAAFLPWFARLSPSTSAGLYDLGGIFSAYSTSC